MTVVEVNNLVKTYHGGIQAVNGLDLNIRKGEIFGLLGPNGAGKSTTIKVILGLLEPTSGDVKVLDFSVPAEIDQLRQNVGYVPQEILVYNHLTVKENLDLFAISYGIKYPKEKVVEVMQLLTLDEIQNQRASNLSGGQKRRLNLALGMLHDPQLLVLDEPSAGMDPQSRNILWDSIREIADKHETTIILTTHLMETADRLADRIAIVDKGRIIALGTPEQLKDEYGNGDILEITMAEGAMFDTDKLISDFGLSSAVWRDTKLLITRKALFDVFIRLMEAIELIVGKDALISMDFHLNTLEDVFIHLTGSELREGGNGK